MAGPHNNAAIFEDHIPKNRPPLKRASTTFVDRVISDWWWWELGSLFLSVACVGAIVSVVSLHNGQPQPEFVLQGITLNAFVSVLAAVSKAALILPISEAIGQLKWYWFQDGAPLWDFQVYDAASRGPWGSFLLLFKSRCRHIASLGALITVLGLAHEPFFQQILTYPERLVPEGQSLTWAATTFISEDTPIIRDFSSGTRKDPSLNMAVEAVFSTSGNAIQSSASRCSTGTCTWPAYLTLGVCHECKDVSHSLQYTCQNHTSMRTTQGATLAVNPCGFHLNDTLMVGSRENVMGRDVTSLSTIIVDTLRTPTRFGPFVNSTQFNTSFENFTLPIANFYVAYTPGGPAAVMRNETPVLTECMLTWCVKSIEAQMFNGSLREVILGTRTIQPATYEEFGTPIVASMGSNDTFEIQNGTTQDFRDLFLSYLPPYLSQSPDYDFGPSPGMWQFHQEAPYDFNAQMEDITTAMTNNLKSRPSGKKPIYGTAWKPQRFVKVRWEWLALPGTSLLGCLALICTTIWKGHRTKAPVWKSSALATLIHGLSENSRSSLDSESSCSEIEATATKLKVRLSSMRRDARLVAI